ncbi:AHH domain-containing protein [Chryseobacterium taihuense]|uniref:A nuclease family of the HNH/ENDO VII superfamily with conserved AHH n=1 Tax=Chryseobacterium taihuense TaxID=1141221 RepID=A0ABY0QZX7_9FLAO|nr:AHH domain-containing protein [Chryseobacterium taihuense]SDM18708.1 A nuclease family of the HNH/ENDO VII superfamily with conserved AHH [Chryseobacterium taihuense]
MATGEVKEVKEVINKGGKKVGQKGEFTTVAGEQIEGILIGVGRGTNKSKFVKAIENGTQDADEFLKLADDSARRQLIRGVDSFNYEEAVKFYGQKVADIIKNRSSIAKNAGKHLAKEFEQAHHLIPIELIQKSKLVRKAIEGGFEFNGKINAKWLKQFSSKFEHLKDGVHASHPQYTERLFNYIENVGIYKYLDDIGKTNIDDLTKVELKQYIEEVTKYVDDIISANPTTKINDLIF